MKNLLTLICCIFLAFNVNGQAALSGKVTDADTGEPILFGDVVVYRNGTLVTGEQTDFDGNYIISPMDPGTYEVVFKYVGYSEMRFVGVIIEYDKETLLNASIEAVTFDFSLLLRVYRPPIIKEDDFEKGQTFTSKNIRNMPIKN